MEEIGGPILTFARGAQTDECGLRFGRLLAPPLTAQAQGQEISLSKKKKKVRLTCARCTRPVFV